MNCQRCDSERLLRVNGKTDDRCSVSSSQTESHGYVPCGINIGGGDYIKIQVCLDCGQLQGEWPVEDPE